MDGDKIRIALAKNIKQYRDNRKLSQAELAFNAGISIPFLSDIERGNKWPSPDTLAKLAEALNIEVFELFYTDIKANSDKRSFASLLVQELLLAQKNATEEICKKYLQ